MGACWTMNTHNWAPVDGLTAGGERGGGRQGGRLPTGPGPRACPWYSFSRAPSCSQGCLLTRPHLSQNPAYLSSCSQHLPQSHSVPCAAPQSACSSPAAQSLCGPAFPPSPEAAGPKRKFPPLPRPLFSSVSCGQQAPHRQRGGGTEELCLYFPYVDALTCGASLTLEGLPLPGDLCFPSNN